jgi:hypothetical protein
MPRPRMHGRVHGFAHAVPSELLTGDVRASAWARATDFYAGYERYRASCAPREIRLFRLRPVAA